MNLARHTNDASDDALLFVNFNQDCTSIAIGKRNGFDLFSLNNVEKLEKIFEGKPSAMLDQKPDSERGDDVAIVERLFSSSLVAIVTLSSPRKLRVCHFKKGSEICNYRYSNAILTVRLNRSRLVVCLEESLYIHNIRDMKVMHTIRDTPPNPQGLCALVANPPDNDNCYLAYAVNANSGSVNIFDCNNLTSVINIPAHNSHLAALSFDLHGLKVATASTKGTVIRVFSVREGQKLFELRRGMASSAIINSLAFSPDATFLCSSSNKDTVHIFKLELPKEKPPVDESQAATWSGMFSNMIKKSAQYLPEILYQNRAHAMARLPCPAIRNVCMLASVQKLLRLMVATEDGYLYIYNFDQTEPSECTLVKQHKLHGPIESGSVATGSLEGLSDLDRPLTHGATYAGAQRRESGDMAPPAFNVPWGPVEDRHFLLDQSFESLAYEELAEDAVGGDLATLKLDDDSEFPPMSHHHGD